MRLAQCLERLAGWPTVEQLTANYIRSAIAAANGNKTAAALALKIDRRTLYRWLERDDERRAANAAQDSAERAA